MDRSWVNSKDRISKEYRDKVEEFLNFSYRHRSENSRIYCPCKDCDNRYFETRHEVMSHLIIRGFTAGYTNWVYHGENYVPRCESIAVEDNIQLDNRENMVDMVHEAFGIPHTNNNSENNQHIDGPDEMTKKFLKLLEDAESELYPGCKNFTKLSFIVRLLHLKVLSSWTNKSFTMLLKLLKEIFPQCDKIPSSYYEAQKIMDELGFNYEMWDACPNNCMLYRGKDKELDKCEICSAPRYTSDGKKIVAKRVRYFPLKPRLQKLFMSSKTASYMRWHEEGRCKDGVLRHPADSQAWKTFDELNRDFASDCRNVRLGLAADGFNPFRTMSVSHSTWPVNGFRFRTKTYESSRCTQNSGVVVKAETMSYSSAKDKNPIAGDVIYYGVLTGIIEIRYTSRIKFVLFKCDWIDNQKGLKHDAYAFTLVNFNHCMYQGSMESDEPFILASQAMQVYYVADPIQSDWQVVLQMSRRDKFDMYEAEPCREQRLDQNACFTRDEDIIWVREGIDGTFVDPQIPLDVNIDL